ncbi:MAG: S8 family serine peptidase [bacterium]|nr:S8 family serine peptidase [bacterium]
MTNLKKSIAFASLVFLLLSGFVPSASGFIRDGKEFFALSQDEAASSGVSQEEVSRIFLKGPDGQKTLLGYGQPDMVLGDELFLSKDLSEKYEIQVEEFKGYIIEFKEKPLAAVKAEREEAVGLKTFSLEESLDRAVTEKEKESLQKQINDIIGSEDKNTRALLSVQSALIKKEQIQAESVIKFLAPKASVKNKFAVAINGVSVDQLSGEEVKKIENKGYKVSPNYKVKAFLYDSVPLIKADKVWKLKDQQGRSITGQGVTIGIIDTGVDYANRELGGCLGARCKVLGGYDFVNNDADPMDDMGHGTHVAAIAAGKGALKGVAPDANLYAYKVLDEFGSGYFDWVIAGIEMAMDPNQDGNLSDHLDVINLSLGASEGNPDDPLSRAVDNAVGAGVVAAVAAGNSGGFATIGSPGTAKQAITVGAADKQDGTSYFSSQGPVFWENKSIMKPDIVAPGVDICAAQWDDWLPEAECLDSKHIAISGTSMATPHVAGAAALIKQKHPTWKPLYIKYALRNTALDILLHPVEQGLGRIDVLKAVQSKYPPIVKLNPISTKKRGTINISGLAKGGNLQNYTISYAPLVPYDPSKFIVLATAPIPPNFKISYVLNLNLIPDGKYILKLAAKDKSGQSFLDYGYFEVNKWDILFPLSSDVIRSGDSIKLKAQVYLSEAYSLSWSYLKPGASVWTRIAGQVWNTTSLPTGGYSLKAVLSYSGGAEEEVLRVYLDKMLKKGWPKRVNWEEVPEEQCGGNCYYWGGFLEPAVSDINGDGFQEIVVLKNGNPPKIYVYKYDGALLWSFGFSVVGASGGFTAENPLIGDINNDGAKEIVILVNNGEYDSPWLYILGSNGQPLQQPISLAMSRVSRFYMLTADLNGDGLQEIVIKPDEGRGRKMTVLDYNGKIIAQWLLPDKNYYDYVGGPGPAVGNFDDDPDLEIVVADPKNSLNNSEIRIFNRDGTLLSGWPVTIHGLIINSGPSVSDLNGDGLSEIVIASARGYYDESPDSGGVYVFDKTGNLLPGWPQMKGFNFIGSPSLGDLDGDNDLEIGISRYEHGESKYMTYLFHHDGKLFSGSPQATSFGNWRSTIMGDVSGNGKSDILATAGEWFSGGGGGLYAWRDTDFQLMRGTPLGIEEWAEASATIADVDKDKKVELIASSDWDFDTVKNDIKIRGSLYVWDLSAAYNPDTMFWPTIHHDEQRTGFLPPPLPLPVAPPPASGESEFKAIKSLTSNVSTFALRLVEKIREWKEYLSENRF